MRRLLIFACAVVFVDVTFFAVLTPLLPAYRSDFDLGEGGVGLLAGSFAAGTVVMALPAGWMAARFGPRRTVITGLVGIGIFSPLFGFAENLVLLDGSRFLQGAAGADLFGAAKKLDDDQLQPLYAGTGAPLIDDLPGAGEVVARIMGEATTALGHH